ncbi:MAG TPA: phosphotransferase [Methylomirabilota bacterium]|jgi:aminoglycoside phosphotransferase (APT) family kinase protein
MPSSSPVSRLSCCPLPLGGRGQGEGGPPTADLAPALLAHLRAALRAPSLAYAEPPAALTGGYDTRIIAFRLSAAPAAWSGPLILRLLGPVHDPLRALRERATQNTLAVLGYPVPRVLMACADRGPLGGGFLVMERAAGRPLLDARRPRVARTLAETHARLHALNPEPLLRALDDEGRAAGWGFDRDTVSFEGHLASLERRIRPGGLPGLVEGIRWLLERRPTNPGGRVICHGDFHPQNLLAVDGRVTAVLDWPNMLVAPPEYDVAATRVILTQTPLALFPVPAALRPLLAAGRRLLVARYLAIYRRLRPLDRTRLPYFEAAACMRGLVRSAETRAVGGAPANALDASSFGERLAARFARVSGVAVALPPRRA